MRKRQKVKEKSVKVNKKDESITEKAILKLPLSAVDNMLGSKTVGLAEKEMGNQDDQDMDDSSDSDFENEVWEEVKEPNIIQEMGANPKVIEIHLQSQASLKKELKNKAIKDRQVRRNLHEIYVLCLISTSIHRNKLCDNLEFQAIIYSHLVEFLRAFSTRAPRIRFDDDLQNMIDNCSGGPSKSVSIQEMSPMDVADLVERAHIEEIIEKLHKHIEIVPYEKSYNFLGFLKTRNISKLSKEEFIIVFVSLLRLFGFTTRLVASLDSWPLTARKSQTFTLFGVGVLDTESNIETNASGKKTSKRVYIKQYMYPIEYLAQVLINDKWVLINPLNRKIKKSRAAEEHKNKSEMQCQQEDDVSEEYKSTLKSRNIMELECKNISYIIALESTKTGFTIIKDLTNYFTNEAVMVYKRRLNIWWNQLLWLFAPSCFTLKQEIELEQEQIKEQEIQDQLQKNEKMPNTLNGFLNHPLFALEKQLKQNEAIYPHDEKSIVGVFRTLPVWPRHLVQKLDSIHNWKTRGIIFLFYTLGVYISADTIPFKSTKSKGKMETVKNWYGVWQAEMEWPVVELLENGEIPKNSFGNIEIFHPNMIPAGCVHLQNSIITKLAKKLGIDHVPAVTGFNHFRGRSTPQVSGIVVTSKNYPKLQKALNDFENELLEKKKMKAILRWRLLVRGLFFKVALDREYLKPK